MKNNFSTLLHPAPPSPGTPPPTNPPYFYLSLCCINIHEKPLLHPTPVSSTFSRYPSPHEPTQYLIESLLYQYTIKNTSPPYSSLLHLLQVPLPPQTHPIFN